MIAYLHFSAGPRGPYQTVSAPVRVDADWTPPPRAGRAATRYRVLWSGRWRRVYSTFHGHTYIGPRHAWIAAAQIVEGNQ